MAHKLLDFGLEEDKVIDLSKDSPVVLLDILAAEDYTV